MADTTPLAPTDAEIAALYAEQTGFILDDSPAALLDFARAVLAKWGAQPVPASAAEFALQALVAAGHVSQEIVDRATTLPGAPQAPAHSVEPVAVALGFVRDDGVFRHAPKFQRPGDTWTPVYTAPQTVAREPRYRLLEPGIDRIEAGDEFLMDDAQTWETDAGGIFVGTLYGNVLRPARRAIKSVLGIAKP